MEVYELCEAPENMAFYVHGQGHAIEHDSRQLIVTIQTLCRRFDFPCCCCLLGSTGLMLVVKCCLLGWENSSSNGWWVWGQYGWMDKHLKPANDRSGTIARLVPEGSPARLS